MHSCTMNHSASPLTCSLSSYAFCSLRMYLANRCPGCQVQCTVGSSTATEWNIPQHGQIDVWPDYRLLIGQTCFICLCNHGCYWILCLFDCYVYCCAVYAMQICRCEWTGLVKRWNHLFSIECMETHQFITRGIWKHLSNIVSEKSHESSTGTVSSLRWLSSQDMK